MSETDEIDEMEQVREKIMLATLANVPFDGWCRDAINAGAIEAGYDADMALRAFPGETGDVIQLWVDWSDAQMLEALDGLEGWEDMSVTARITAAVKARIMVNAQHRETLRRTLSWYALPLNVPLAVQATLSTVNSMWYAAGDTSTDFNYYSKRGLLTTVYTATVLYWMSDEGDEEGNFPETWDFLERRLGDLGTVSKVADKVKGKMQGAC
ncbi:MAG: COQ9 family protein [Rhodospirillales bacterium]|jgi:ubiquinone biosynthesis protein COQ9|nr:COQ9 family protein [Rhodospirillales bacterium]